MTTGIVAVVELPNEEMYFLDLEKMVENNTQKEYRELIEDALNNEEDYNSMVAIDGNIAISSGGQHDMQSALVELPCLVTHYLMVEVD
jgi:hypothetical protein